MIALQGVTKFLGKKDLFQGVSFHIDQGDRIGLVGPNGAGKTTLFQVILGETEPDSGAVLKSRGLRLGYLPQQWTPLEGKTVLAHAMDVNRQIHVIRDELQSLQQQLDAVTEAGSAGELALRQTILIEQLEHLGEYDLEARARKVLAGLGFGSHQMDRPISALSGGWVMRLELARLLLAEPDLLLLDEPTNHLDLDSLLWLEEYLLSTSSAVLVVAHDRAFLNRVVRRIIELEQGQMQQYTGNYDAYIEEKARRQQTQQAAFKNQQEKIKQVERFVDRNRYRKDRARQVQSRLKLLDKVERIEGPPEQQATIHFAFPDPLRSGKRVMELQQVHKAYGEHTVYAGIDLIIDRGDRIALIGPNGAGKSTLLKMLAGVESISAGERRTGHQAAIGYYAQYQWEQLHLEWTVLDEASSVAGDLPQSQLRSLLGAFLFRGDDVLKRTSVLSGGEKARLTLCKLLLQRPNVLMLDEPTNHLDIPSRDVLERALLEFPGTICFISHDRHFINAIANKVLFIQSGDIHLFPGNFDDFHHVWKQRLDGESSQAAEAAAPQREDKSDGAFRSAQERKRSEAEWRNELYRLKRPMQERLRQAESLLEEAHQRLDYLNGCLADPETYREGKRVQELQKEFQQCRQTIQEISKEWEESALRLEELEEGFRKDKTKACER